MFYHLGRRWKLRSRWLYLAFFAVLASQGRFISLVLTDSLHFSESQVGLILGAGVISSMMATPFWSRRADGPDGCLVVERRLIAMHALFFGSFAFASLVEDDTGRFVLVAFLRFLASSCMSRESIVLSTRRGMNEQLTFKTSNELNSRRVYAQDD